jgi:hypothetical protein
MQRYLNKYICELLLAVLSCYYVYTKDMNNCYDKAIMAEGHGYYAYLLSSYIYHDPTFTFFNTLYPKYYCHSFDPPTRNFINAFDGIHVNKYYPGVSLLWLPFFLFAHVLALIAGWSADGYSDVYQYAIGLAGILYTYFGLRYTRNVLRWYAIPEGIQTMVLIMLLFGTNLLIYAGAWSAQSHPYSFFLIAAFSYHTLCAFHEGQKKPGLHLGLSVLFFVAAVTVRPQSACIVILLPLFGFHRDRALRLVQNNLRSPYLAGALIISALLFARVIYYWYIQTGQLFLNPYHGEHYRLNNPHVMDFLFSYRKGWLLYTPFAFIGLAGIFLFPTNRERLTLVVFWSLLIYVSASWWCWTYSQTSFGQRTLVDFYVFIALQAAVCFKWMKDRGIKGVHYLVALVVIPLNVLQTYQYRHGILDGDLCTKETYRKYFFETGPVAYYSVPSQSILEKKKSVLDFESDLRFGRTDKTFFSGKQSAVLCHAIPFSEGIKEQLPAFATGDGYTALRVTSKVKTNRIRPDEMYLVMDVTHGGKSASYSNFALKDFLLTDKWTEVQFGTTLPEEIIPGDTVNVYFWNASANTPDTLWIDDMELEIMHTDHSYDLNK